MRYDDRLYFHVLRGEEVTKISIQHLIRKTKKPLHYNFCGNVLVSKMA